MYLNFLYHDFVAKLRGVLPRWDIKSKKLVTFKNSQTNNDRWILDMLDRKENGFFVEAGAMDGISNSSTFVLEKYFNWKGILIEADSDYKSLGKNRPNSICLNKILSDKDGTEEFILFPMTAYSCTESSFLENKEKIIRVQKDIGNFSYKKIRIEAVPLAALLKEHNAPKIIDYLALDIEGSELKVLKDFPFERYKFRCIAIEGHRCDELLFSKGYKKVINKYNINAPWESYFLLN